MSARQFSHLLEQYFSGSQWLIYLGTSSVAEMQESAIERGRIGSIDTSCLPCSGDARIFWGVVVRVRLRKRKGSLTVLERFMNAEGMNYQLSSKYSRWFQPALLSHSSKMLLITCSSRRYSSISPTSSNLTSRKKPSSRSPDHDYSEPDSSAVILCSRPSFVLQRLSLDATSSAEMKQMSLSAGQILDISSQRSIGRTETTRSRIQVVKEVLLAIASCICCAPEIDWLQASAPNCAPSSPRGKKLRSSLFPSFSIGYAPIAFLTTLKLLYLQIPNQQQLFNNFDNHSQNNITSPKPLSGRKSIPKQG